MQSLRPSLSTKPNETKSQAFNTQSLRASIFDTLDDIIHNFIDLPPRPAVDPRLMLLGNFAPVNELPPTESRIIFGHYDPANGIGVANTSLALFGDRLYAHHECDLPYALRLTSDGDIETLGRHDFGGTLLTNMTAHPQGNKHPDVHIMSMPHPSFFHDFAITKNYALFSDIEMRMKKPKEMIFQGGNPIFSNPTKVARVGEDDGNAIVMLAPSVTSIQQAFERFDLVCSRVEKVRIDLHTGLVTRQPISSRKLELAVINHSYLAKKNMYVYSGASRMYGPGCYGGVPFFVAKEAENLEDDRYLLTYVHNENTGELRFLVMDAK
ncbi:Nine-cis-epoxycarotenoid dioxygenase 4 [Hibiscus syriacus]|uniref:Nine-cis-epoxycarotenoid dioxygenase 4 n=1 Tax=Hibiscus syriacus TaxID=106335 RepID=A0A6A3BJ45_HIBSY|nr:Nine-cis-epoxycarotenoid dioxygenase 4 [Hibiscus syriacus]